MKMGQLTRILGSKGYTILVVPELKFLTVGGLICGAGLETSSHKYGFFHNTCTSYEVVLSSGEVVKCSKVCTYADFLDFLSGIKIIARSIYQSGIDQ